MAKGPANLVGELAKSVETNAEHVMVQAVAALVKVKAVLKLDTNHMVKQRHARQYHLVHVSLSPDKDE